MNTAGTRQLLSICVGSMAWLELGDRHNIRDITVDRMAFVIFADHVETWCDQLQRVIKALQSPQGDDFTPMRSWPRVAWLAYYEGKLAEIDTGSARRLVSIGSGEREATPNFSLFRQLFEEATALLRKLREDPSAAATYPEHKSDNLKMGDPE